MYLKCAIYQGEYGRYYCNVSLFEGRTNRIIKHFCEPLPGPGVNKAIKKVQKRLIRHGFKDLEYEVENALRK